MKKTGIREGTVLMDQAEFLQAVKAMASYINLVADENPDLQILPIAIKDDGVSVMEYVAQHNLRENVLSYGSQDVTLYRDDINENHHLNIKGGTSLPEGVKLEDSIVILVDSVIGTGRTIRASLNELTDQGRAQGIKLATIYDRNERETPIQPDFVYKKIDLPSNISAKLEGTGFFARR